jgi:hypothetical protein
LPTLPSLGRIARTASLASASRPTVSLFLLLFAVKIQPLLYLSSPTQPPVVSIY